MSELKFPIRIQLTSRLEDFEELFFQNGKLAMTLQSPVLFYFLWSIALLIIDILILSLTTVSNSAWFILIMIGIISVFWWYETTRLFYSRWQWWNQISMYMQKVSKIKYVEITLTEATFQIKIDEHEHILNWSNIGYVHFNQKYISIQGKEHFTIPYKSISTGDRELLKNVIRKQMRQAEDGLFRKEEIE